MSMNELSLAEIEYEQHVRECVRAALTSGASDLNEVLQETQGADPVLVAKLIDAERAKATVVHIGGSFITQDDTSSISYRLPAPDPSRSQWWFSTRGLSYISTIVRAQAARLSPCRIFSLGTPTLGWNLARSGIKMSVLDVDRDVISSLKPLTDDVDLIEYDAADELPSELIESFDIAVLDPPWYSEAIYTFLSRALTASKMMGEIYCTLPGRLTRPGTEIFRAQLIRDLISSGHEILALEGGTVHYQVPRFELAALKHLDGFKGVPWRAGDFLHIRKTSNKSIPKNYFTRNLHKSSPEILLNLEFSSGEQKRPARASSRRGSKNTLGISARVLTSEKILIFGQVKRQEL